MPDEYDDNRTVIPTSTAFSGGAFNECSIDLQTVQKRLEKKDDGL